MKWTENKSFLTAVSIAVFLTAAVMGAFEDSVTVKNFLSMGDINISLEEYEQDSNGQELLYVKEKNVLPGQVISKIPRITNLGEDCWVRARIRYANSMLEQEGLDDSCVQGIKEDWILQGEYYYYKKILHHGEKIDFFQEVTIPAVWNENHANQQLAMEIEADAIQSDNFEPDFNAASPWEDIPIEVCVHEENGSVQSIKEHVELKVEFEGTAHKLIAVPDDFFSNFGVAMPGDELEDQVILKNTTENKAELYFRTSVDSLDQEKQDLLEQIQLTICYKDKTLYQGNLLAKEIEKAVSLGTYNSGEEGSLNFKLEVPARLNNAYALRKGEVNWIFSVREDEKEIENPTKEANANVVTENVKTEDVKTGDDSKTVFFIILLCFSGLILLMIDLKKKGDCHEKK